MPDLFISNTRYILISFFTDRQDIGPKSPQRCRLKLAGSATNLVQINLVQMDLVQINLVQMDLVQMDLVQMEL